MLIQWLPAIAGVGVLALAYGPRVYHRIRRRLGYRKKSQIRRIKAARRVLGRLTQIEHFPQKLAYLRKIDPFTFEELVLEAFARRGCPIRRNRRYTGDGGIDGQVMIRGYLYLIQAKRYRWWISAKHVQDFSALVARRDCRGVFVHTGRTGGLSRSAANAAPNVSIISGKRLMRLLEPVTKASETLDRSDNHDWENTMKSARR